MRGVRWQAFAIALCLVALPARFDAAPASPIQRALGFLFFNQLQRPLDVVINGQRILDFPGNWPQYFRLQGTGTTRVRDVSPFTVAFIHHSLASIV
jgi:hypothetical protein